MQRVQQGDMVEIIAGKDKGLRGEVVRVLTKKDRVIINGVKHHEAPQQSASGAGRAADSGADHRV